MALSEKEMHIGRKTVYLIRSVISDALFGQRAYLLPAHELRRAGDSDAEK